MVDKICNIHPYISELEKTFASLLKWAWNRTGTDVGGKCGRILDEAERELGKIWGQYFVTGV